MHTRPTRSWILALLAGACLAPSLAAQDDDETPCEETAIALRSAGQSQAMADFWVGFASCTNVTRRSDSLACFRDNAAALKEALALVAEQFEARDDLCDALGGARYDPRIDPRDFVRGVTNPLFPQVLGRTKLFRKVTAEGTETIEVTATRDTKTILGVPCLVVHDVVTLDGEPVEDTLDYFAQDRAGNVWYFGELALNFEDGELVDLDGSWTAGVENARPGIVMKAAPALRNVYRQEFSPSVAEDAARVTGLGRTVTVPYGTLTGCLETLDFSPLEPGHAEAKFYAPGLGVVLEVNLETGARTELIGIF